MSENLNWQCDGIPKNGKTYEGLGGKHELIENFSDTCSFCALPREATLESSPPPPPWWILIFGVAIISGGAIALNSCLIERFFIKCPTDQENSVYTSRYNDISKQAQKSRDKFLQSSDLKSMQAERENLSDVITDLGTIKKLKSEKCCPILIYPTVAKQFPMLKDNLSDMDVFISTEKLAVDADKIAQSAKTIADIEKAKNGFKNAIISINKVSGSSFFAKKIDVKQAEYQKQLKILDEKSKALEQKLKQEKMEKQRMEEERQQEEKRQKQGQRIDDNPPRNINPRSEPPKSEPPKGDDLPSCDIALFGNCRP